MTEMTEDRRGWHLNKGIDAAHILATVGLIITGFFFLAAQDKRISNLELAVKYAQESRSSQDRRTEQKLTELKTDLRAINAKLDRLIESQMGTPFWAPDKTRRNQ